MDTPFLRPKITVDRERLIELCRAIVQCHDLDRARGEADPPIPAEMINELNTLSFAVDCGQSRALNNARLGLI